MCVWVLEEHVDFIIIVEEHRLSLVVLYPHSFLNIIIVYIVATRALITQNAKMLSLLADNQATDSDKHTD